MPSGRKKMARIGEDLRFHSEKKIASVSMELSRTCFFLVFSISIICRSNGSDTIFEGQSLLPNQTMISKERKFEVGFFSPGNSSNYYVGIWYKNISLQTVVWVLNRNDPIPSTLYNNSRLEMNTSSLKLMVNSEAIWRSAGSIYATEAVILDNGNFVLRNASGIQWQSFDDPTDTWLPGAMLGFKWPSDKESKLVSWRNENDPAIGDYSLRLNSNGGGELFISSGSNNLLWRSGIWQGGSFASLYSGGHVYNFPLVLREGSAYVTYNASVIYRIVLKTGGEMNHFVWSEVRQEWVLFLSRPINYCNVYASCGPNAVCNVHYAPPCQCLDGFVLQVKGDGDAFDFSGGCIRMRPLQCGESNTEYMVVQNITFPANAEPLEVRANGICEFVCNANCSCTAYANRNGGGCLFVMGDLIDSESVQDNSGVTLYLKMSSNETAELLPIKGKRNVHLVAIIAPITSAILLLLLSCFCICYLRHRKLKRKEPRGARKNVLLLDLKTYIPAYGKRASVGNNQGVYDQINEYELPVFSFSSIAASTNNFSASCKLGEGGFGPVYKAELSNKQFVAVKKLSKMSGQGLEEFKNEIELIAKLQHRNLVGIIGCCVENEEKILVYEYMPNKSLDFFLFDPIKKAQLNWKSRVHIIEGIAQGLLYLHHYSRLRIVHRDLKASNILLDAEMNPKISDFGMARIFRGNDQQANTKRIVGTYGYMSPEYAMEGLFSLKSDVFAFGVLMLEIMNGKKNTAFYGSDYLSLLGYAWNMWKQERAVELVDPILEIPAASSSSAAALRYIKIGLLCVQENPADRPLMSDVVAMLKNQETAIESPRHPAYTVGRSLAEASPTELHKVEICSANGLTVSHMEAR